MSKNLKTYINFVYLCKLFFKLSIWISVDFLVFLLFFRDFLKKYKLKGLPSLILVNSEGEAVDNDVKTRIEVSAFFSIYIKSMSQCL